MLAVNTPTIYSLNSEVDAYLATHSSTSLVIRVGPEGVNPVGFSQSSKSYGFILSGNDTIALVLLMGGHYAK